MWQFSFVWYLHSNVAEFRHLTCKAFLALQGTYCLVFLFGLRHWSGVENAIHNDNLTGSTAAFSAAGVRLRPRLTT